MCRMYCQVQMEIFEYQEERFAMRELVVLS